MVAGPWPTTARRCGTRCAKRPGGCGSMPGCASRLPGHGSAVRARPLSCCAPPWKRRGVLRCCSGHRRTGRARRSTDRTTRARCCWTCRRLPAGRSPTVRPRSMRGSRRRPRGCGATPSCAGRCRAPGRLRRWRCRWSNCATPGRSALPNGRCRASSRLARFANAWPPRPPARCRRIAAPIWSGLRNCRRSSANWRQRVWTRHWARNGADWTPISRRSRRAMPGRSACGRRSAQACRSIFVISRRAAPTCLGRTARWARCWLHVEPRAPRRRRGAAARCRTIAARSWQGWTRLRRLSFISTPPRSARRSGIAGAGCRPISTAWRRAPHGRSRRAQRWRPASPGRTLWPACGVRCAAWRRTRSTCSPPARPSRGRSRISARRGMRRTRRSTPWPRSAAARRRTVLRRTWRAGQSSCNGCSPAGRSPRARCASGAAGARCRAARPRWVWLRWSRR